MKTIEPTMLHVASTALKRNDYARSIIFLREPIYFQSTLYLCYEIDRQYAAFTRSTLQILKLVVYPSNSEFII